MRPLDVSGRLDPQPVGTFLQRGDERAGSGRSRCSRTAACQPADRSRSGSAKAGSARIGAARPWSAWSSRSQGIKDGLLGHHDAKRKDVDEHANHRLHPAQLGRPTRDGDAEQDIAPAAVSAQEHSPGTLDQGAEREPTRTRECLERGRHIRRKCGSRSSATVWRECRVGCGERLSSPSGVAAVTPLKRLPPVALSLLRRHDPAARRRNRETAGSVSMRAPRPRRIAS